MRRALATLALAASVAACATPPKPRELEAFDKIRKDPGVADATKRSPDLVTGADTLGARANDEWQSNDLEESRRDALMAQIKLKTALALTEQDRLKAQIEKLSGQQAAAEEEYASVSKDLANANENFALFQKNVELRKAADADRAKAAEQMTTEQQKAAAEQARLTAQLLTEQKITAAQITLRTADTVDASQYAGADYRAANEQLERAQAALKESAFEAAQASADMAKKSAETAIELSKPKYEEASQASASAVRDEALKRDASGIPGVSIRNDRRGELQRLVLSASDLFVKKQTTIGPGHEAVLDGLAELVKKYPSYPVQVIGHTDNKGKAGELVALSLSRAQSVTTALIERGVEARRLMTSGLGPDEPIAENHGAGRAKNNRVEIVFLYH
ncbi:MAG TPA: OmpA family protein [Polyangia bacterium]|nr:OmpA family protein [Polyangia bacterium]